MNPLIKSEALSVQRKELSSKGKTQVVAESGPGLPASQSVPRFGPSCCILVSQIQGQGEMGRNLGFEGGKGSSVHL